MLLCEYGCNQAASFLTTNNRHCCSKSPQSCPAIVTKNSEGVKKAHSEGRVPGWDDLRAKGINTAWNKGSAKADFSLNGKGNHKGVLILEFGNKCQKCQLETWQDQPIPIELEHIDGNNKNNTKENLTLLCCNCHALTSTWRGRNSKRIGRCKVSEEELSAALASSYSIKEALNSVGLAAKGGNYTRCNRLIKDGLQLKKV